MRIAVYCAATLGNVAVYQEAAKELGRWIGENGHTLVYGGGDSGLMGIIAQEVYAHGSKVIGVVPANVPMICNRPQPYCTEVLSAPDMNARKSKMLSLADAFIALPGGIGTMDEITEAITLTKIGVFQKKAVLWNSAGFYEPFRQMLQTMDQAGYLNMAEMKHVLFSDKISEVDAFLKA